MKFVYVVIITDEDFTSESSTRLEEVTEEAFDKRNFIMAPNERVLLYRGDPDEALMALQMHRAAAHSESVA